MLILENNHPPMKKLTQPWKLCRSFGSQPVGNVAGPRWPEAGIATQVLPSQSLRWTFRKGQSPTADLPTCRLADLPTCRLADLPTCRLADLPTCRLADLNLAAPRTLPPASIRMSGVSTQVSCLGPRLPVQGIAIVWTSHQIPPCRTGLLI
jgi:hypothetical protein